MAISDWPHQERPREILLKRGAETLSDAELLAVFFRNGYKGKTAIDLARDSLKQFGDLRQFLGLTQSQLQQIKGIGAAKIALLQAALELGKRYLKIQLEQQDILNNPEASLDYLKAKLSGKRHEVFACLFLNTQYHLIAYEELFQGTLNQTAVYPRVILEAALKHHAAAVIISHNHPSGQVEPSLADKYITLDIQKALELVDIKLIDHIIIGGGRNLSYSFLEHGDL